MLFDVIFAILLLMLLYFHEPFRHYLFLHCFDRLCRLPLPRFLFSAPHFDVDAAILLRHHAAFHCFDVLLCFRCRFERYFI